MRLKPLYQAIEETKAWDKDGIEPKRTLQSIRAYSDLLNSDITMGMLAPCTEDGKLLISRNNMDNIVIENESLAQYYDHPDEIHEATKRVKFTGIRLGLCKNKLEPESEQFIGVTINGTWHGGWDNFVSSYLGGIAKVYKLTELKQEVGMTSRLFVNTIWPK